MAETALPLDPRALESLLAFWAEAGVDVMLADAPVDRLAARPPKPTAPPARIAEAAPSPPLPPSAASTDRPGATPEASAAVEEAVRLAAEAGDLPALAEAIGRFEGCALRFQGAARATVWRGAAEPWVVAIGDAPTLEDEDAGEPFRSPGGRIAEALLDAAGFKDRVLYLSSVFWRTPGGAAPSPADHAACLPFVERALALTRPRALLAFGGAAAKGVLGEAQPILKIRGQWRDWTGRHEALTLPALPTLAQSFLLAHPLSRREVWGDVLSLANRLDLPDGRL